MKVPNCPAGHGEMTLRRLDKNTAFRGVDVAYQAEAFVCRECGLEVADVAQAGATQRAISDAYRKAKGLLTGEEIKGGRKRLGLTQKDLADLLSVGIASIKRWETGIIQSQSMDRILRATLNPHIGGAFNDSLGEDGILQEVEAASIKRALAFQIEREMKSKGLSKRAMSKRMNASRSSLKRLLDPENEAVTLKTMMRAAAALGKRMRVELS
jgi:putative zinc finger/helix-turn-helix YgiT family protein